MTTTLTPKTISQHKLKRYLELEIIIKEHKDLKAEILALAESGLPCQPGPMSCRVDISATTSTAWKQEFISVAGEGAAERISARDKGNSSRRTLVVTDRNNPVQG